MINVLNVFQIQIELYKMEYLAFVFVLQDILKFKKKFANVIF